jgi:hypothetical protein
MERVENIGGCAHAVRHSSFAAPTTTLSSIYIYGISLCGGATRGEIVKNAKKSVGVRSLRDLFLIHKKRL